MLRAGPSTQRAGPNQLPPATYDLLQTLLPEQSRVFPVSAGNTLVRPDTTDDDTAEARLMLAQRASFIRIVLGGWMGSLASEEGKNGSHSATKTTETIDILLKSIDGPLHFLKSRPSVLIFRPEPPKGNSKSNPPPPTLHAGRPAIDVESLGDEDLATFLLPRILRAASSLETALLSSSQPDAGTTDDLATLWRDRQALKLKLEALLIAIVRVLAESAVRVEWHAKEGGLGKAREMMGEMIKMLSALVPSPNSPRPDYPRTLRLFDSTHNTTRAAIVPGDVSNLPDLAITLRSALHSRALLLTTLRILRSLSTSCAFLSDFTPNVIDILVQTWPNSHASAASKGKERAQDYERVLAATLDLVVEVIEHPIQAFAGQETDLLAPRIVEELQARLGVEVGGDEEMEVDGESAETQVDAALAKIFASLWRDAKEEEGIEGGQGKLRRVLATAIVESGDRMVDCLMGGEASPELRLASVFTLAFPFFSRPPPSGADSHLHIPAAATQVLAPARLHDLGSLLPSHPSLPFDLPSPIAKLHTLAQAAWEALGTDLVLVINVQPTEQTKARKRKRDQFSAHPSSDAMEGDTNAPPPSVQVKRRKAGWMDSVAEVLRRMNPPESLDTEDEGVEAKVVRLAKLLPKLSPDSAVGTLKAIGLLGCARDGTLTFSPPLHDPNLPNDPSCSVCDIWSGSAAFDHDEATGDHPRAFANKPLKELREAAKTVLDPAVGDPLRLEFVKTLARTLRHSKNTMAAIGFGGVADRLMESVWAEMEAATRGLRLAAGNVILAIVQAHQEKDASTAFVADLCGCLDSCLTHQRPAVIETTLVTLGRIARLAVPQGLLECRCLERFVTRLGHPNTFLKSVARTQLEQVATHRDVKPYALIQPHFAVIAPLLLSSKAVSPTTLSAALDCFHQPRDTLLRITREYTLPSVVLLDQTSVLRQIAEASKLSIPVMLTEGQSAAAVLAYLYMRPPKERDAGLTVLMREVSPDRSVPLWKIIDSVKVPLIYKLALELGDDDTKIHEQAKKALQNVEQQRRQTKNSVDLAVVMKESIVGILSHMNRGLNESTNHRPLREKQRIIRSLQEVTRLVGPAIAGFSPQIMATLQSALDFEGLRDVTLEAFRVFIVTLKFSEIGPFIGTTSATFVRLWPEFSPAAKKTAAATLSYVIVENAPGLASYVQDVADLSGIPELEETNKRLQDIRKNWSFSKRSEYLLGRIGSENDVVALQALRELKILMTGNTPQLQAFSAGDSFNQCVGPLVKTLLGAAVKDGPENEQIRNVAFECIGILGALDPDRFEMAPADAPFIVTRDFNDQEESIKFALHLIQHLLIGAYRSTNDTKHQEFLAYAIQELLSFCGFTADLVTSGSSVKAVDAVARKRWNELPKWVLETCGPLLGGSFSFKERTSPHAAEYPIYSSTASYRDWIRIWANDLISKLKGTAVKRIFQAFPPVLHLEDIAVAQHLLPHLVLNALIAGSDEDRQKVRVEIETVLTDQVSPTHQLSENSRLLSAQTVFDLMDHLSRWITQARKCRAEISGQSKSKSKAKVAAISWWSESLIPVEGILGDIPHILVGQAALTCKAYARSLLNFESHIVDRHGKGDATLQTYYENLHECYADLDEPDGMEGISTKIISPSVLHQIREHESTGRWTSAQSCWEVKLQQKPDEPANHIGLLRCLRNLGHYDSMKTHIVGILHSRNEQADWDRILAPFTIEASLIVGDWDAVEHALMIPDIEGAEVSFGKVVGAMRLGDPEQVAKAFFEAREQLGGPIVAAGRESYRRVYDSIVHLHILQELSAIHNAHLAKPGSFSGHFLRSLNARLDSTSPSFRAREPILNMRRTAFRLAPTQAARSEIGELWLETSKIARKAGHSQTAYSAILQAQDLEAKFAFLQSAKLLKAGDQTYKAIQEIDNALQRLIPSSFRDDDPTKRPKLAQHGPPTPLAKASLRRARWMHEAGRLEHNEILLNYLETTYLAPDWEAPHYYLGHYYDQAYELTVKAGDTGYGTSAGLIYRTYTCKSFSQALTLGTKYIYQAMPRMLTIWLEIGEHESVLRVSKEKKTQSGKVHSGVDQERYDAFRRINRRMENNREKLPPYQWLTVLPQLVSRIMHPNETLHTTLEKIFIKVLHSYPHQGFWAMASGAKSQTARRSQKNLKVFGQAKASAEPGSDILTILDQGLHLVDQLLHLCNHNITKNDPLVMEHVFPALYKLAPMRLIIPLQNSLNVTLPADASRRAEHKPFPERLPIFHKFDNEVLIMASLQKPRKISVYAEDGSKYGFLCKPKDDLRKDARLMEFNSMIIKLLKKDSDARNRRLTIRTYSVVPLNEECGLIEWVPNVVVLRGILNKLYAARNIQGWSPDLKKVFDTIRDNPATTGERFETQVLVRYPPVFHEWFLETFPEPSAWLRARLAYSRTAAVISMVGFVLGLGDRHCENILLDGTTGDTVHVDFNCLFDRGRTFDVAEQVPFRLTTNIIDGMGVTGVEGVFRKAAEISLRILRDNQDSLMSVLETFVHDPLVEWNKKSTSKEQAADHIHKIAKKNLDPISSKLRGLQVTSNPASTGEKEVSVGEQVERLIREARSSKNLGSMYVGWCAWF